MNSQDDQSRYPTVSVLMPAYNSERFIKEAIESILNQSVCDFEFIILNDGSNDRTDDIIKTYNDHRIIYKNYRVRVGLVELLNEGLTIAKGKYVARMDADDVALPNRFAEQVKYMEENSDVGICGSWIEFIGDQAGIEKRPVAFEEIQYALFFGCPLTHPTFMMRNEMLKKFDLKYDRRYYYAEDHELLLRASFHFKIINLPTVLLKYRTHAAQIGSASWMEQAKVRNAIQAKIFCEILMPCPKEELEWVENFLLEESSPEEVSISCVETFKKKIIEENRKKRNYPEDVLSKAADELFKSKIRSNLSAFFSKKYYNKKPFKLSLLASFVTDKNNPYKYFSLKRTVYFVTKCILNYNVKHRHLD